MSLLCFKHYSHSPFHLKSQPTMSIGHTGPPTIISMTSSATNFPLMILLQADFWHRTFALSFFHYLECSALRYPLTISLITFKSLLQTIHTVYNPQEKTNEKDKEPNWKTMVTDLNKFFIKWEIQMGTKKKEKKRCKELISKQGNAH